MKEPTKSLRKSMLLKLFFKKIDLTKVSDAEKNALKREITFQQSVNHPYIVRLYANFEKNQQLYIILELVQNGTLFKLMRKNFLSEKQVVFYFKQILEAIQFIHERKTIHRDIKPENILISNDNTIKICDFGFCAPFGQDIVRQTMCGTREYLAPEVANKSLQNEKVDVWCLGILLYEMTHKKTPFESQQVFLMANDKRRPRILFKPTLNKDFKYIIDSCLQINPQLRPSVKQILEMPIFQQKDSFSKYQKKSNKIIDKGLFSTMQLGNNNMPLNKTFQSNQNQIQQKQLNQQNYIKQGSYSVTKTKIRRANSTINQRTTNLVNQSYSPVQNTGQRQFPQNTQNIIQPNISQRHTIVNLIKGSQRSYTPNINEHLKKVKYSLNVIPQKNPLAFNFQRPQIVQQKVQFFQNQSNNGFYQIVKK